jgi:hypothetical protein
VESDRVINSQDSSDHWLDEPTHEVESESSSSIDESDWPHAIPDLSEQPSDWSETSLESDSSSSSSSSSSRKHETKRKKSKSSKQRTPKERARTHNKCGNGVVDKGERCDGEEFNTFFEWCDDECDLKTQPWAVWAFILGLVLALCICYVILICVARYRASKRKSKTRSARE